MVGTVLFPEGQIKSSSPAARRSDLADGNEAGECTGHILPQQKSRGSLNVLNKLAAEGILAVIDSIARRCISSPSAPTLNVVEGGDGLTPRSNSGRDYPFPSVIAAASDPMDGGQGSSSSVSSSFADSVSDIESEEDGCFRRDNDSGLKSQTMMRHRLTSEVLAMRKRRKRRLAETAREFNKRPTGKEWVGTAERGGLLPSPATAASVAKFLHSATAGLDKDKVGIYLSRGPKEKYLFHAEVLREFSSLFDFTGMDFASALRAFLRSFRLPGEAQCIDRLMEAFAVRLYGQQQSGEEEGRVDGIFQNADAVYVLAFSTIMLHTDLHNPSIKDDRKMTADQFVRNNRGINGGQDLPMDFLVDLYCHIRDEEIEVQLDLSDALVLGANRHHWELLSAKTTEVAEPFFTPTDTARRTVFRAGIHEKDMFLAFATDAIRCLSHVFSRSWDDLLVVKTLKGFKQMATVCVYFRLDEMFNQILEILLQHGKEYIVKSISLAYSAGHDKITNASSTHYSSDGEEEEGDSSSSLYDEKDFGKDGHVSISEHPPVPLSFLAYHSGDTNTSAEYVMKVSSHLTIDVVRGIAAHRGLLSLDYAFTLVRNQTPIVRESLPLFLHCIFALRDAHALPVGMEDLDDFADVQGNMLSPSPFALRCGQKVYAHIISTSSLGKPHPGGFWGSVASLFKIGQTLKKGDNIQHDIFFGDFIDYATLKSFPEGHNHCSRTAALHSSPSRSKELLSIAQAAHLDKILMTKDHQVTLRMLRILLDATNPDVDAQGEVVDSDLMFEQHAVFALELAAHSLLSHRNRAHDLYPLFLSTFESILAPESPAPSRWLAMKRSGPRLVHPFLMERAVVTILRLCIHLYDIPEVSVKLLWFLSLVVSLTLAMTTEIPFNLPVTPWIWLLCLNSSDENQLEGISLSFA